MVNSADYIKQLHEKAVQLRPLSAPIDMWSDDELSNELARVEEELKYFNQLKKDIQSLIKGLKKTALDVEELKDGLGNNKVEV